VYKEGIACLTLLQLATPKPGYSQQLLGKRFLNVLRKDDKHLDWFFFSLSEEESVHKN
jgi:hypothetical protein